MSSVTLEVSITLSNLAIIIFEIDLNLQNIGMDDLLRHGNDYKYLK